MGTTVAQGFDTLGTGTQEELRLKQADPRLPV